MSCASGSTIVLALGNTYVSCSYITFALPPIEASKRCPLQRLQSVTCSCVHLHSVSAREEHSQDLWFLDLGVYFAIATTCPLTHTILYSNKYSTLRSDERLPLYLQLVMTCVRVSTNNIKPLVHTKTTHREWRVSRDNTKTPTFYQRWGRKAQSWIHFYDLNSATQSQLSNHNYLKPLCFLTQLSVTHYMLQRSEHEISV